MGGLGLATLWAAHALTTELAPSVRVRWQDDVSSTRQAELERRYLLANPRAPMAEAPRSIAYDLLDTSRRNIEALVKDRQIADTNDIDRDTYIVRATAGRGERRRWVAHNIPGLRDSRTRWSVIALITALAALSLIGFPAKLYRGIAWLNLGHIESRDAAGAHAGAGDYFRRWADVPPLLSSTSV